MLFYIITNNILYHHYSTVNSVIIRGKKNMVFENLIQETNWLSCQNGKKTLEKKFIISRELADEYNKIIAVFNKENEEITLTNSLLFIIIFSDFLECLQDMAESQAVELLTNQANAVIREMEY